MRFSQPSIAIREAVNHDVAARADLQLLGLSPIPRVGTGSVDRAIKLTVLIAPIKDVVSFWSLVVTLARFWVDRSAAQGTLYSFRTLS